MAVPRFLRTVHAVRSPAASLPVFVFSRESVMSRHRLGAFAALLLATVPAAAQSRLPAVRSLGPITARSAEPLGAVSAAVPLPDGRVLVNDVLQRRVVMFDSTLAQVTVVADTTSATANAYGARGGGLIGYRGDSALFIDPASLSMITVNPKGELTTVRAVPRANEITALSGAQGRPGFDAQGRLIYRATPRPRAARRDARPVVGNFVMPELPDSAPIIRLDMANRTGDLASRASDTVAALKINRPDVKVTQGADGRISVNTTVHPMPSLDEWALLSDGTVAVIRGHDFHVDRYKPDGTVTSSPKLPFEWQRLDDDAKVFIIDSARTAMEKQREEAQRMMANAGGPMAFMQAGGGEMVMSSMGGGGMGGAFVMMGGAGGGPPQRGGQGGGQGGGPNGARGGQGGNGFQLPPINLINPNELPDYRPPFLAQAALGDLDGNLWVRTTAAPNGDGGALYYVIDSADNVVDRVQVPQGRIIAGFGKGGVVYLAFRDTEGRAFLETVRVR